MLKKILIGLVVLLVVLVVLIVRQPEHYKVVRTATIAAPTAEVFPLINDFHRWDKWSPWAKIDPNMKTTYSGPEQGTGAVYEWKGNNDVGEGRMTILESVPTELIGVKLEFIKPFESNAITTFLLKPQGDSATHVSWEMTGDNNFMSKAMSLFASMDSMIGSDFEKGLAQMKAAAESARK